MDPLQQAYTGNKHTRSGIFNIRLITRLIKRLVCLVHYSPEPTESHSITKKKIEDFHQITKTLKNNGFPSGKCSLKKYLQYHNIRKTETVYFDTYVQGVSEPMS